MKRKIADCPEGLCHWCWEKGLDVEATSQDGTLCEEHVTERAEIRADFRLDAANGGGQ